MHIFTIIMATCSIVLQLVASYNFARMTTKTHRNLPWILLSAGIFLMVIRRLCSIYIFGISAINETLATIISVMMVTSSFMMPRLFKDFETQLSDLQEIERKTEKAIRNYK